MTIRRNVEYILYMKGMNKAELAERALMTSSSLSVFLDSNNLGLKAIQKIAKALGVKPADLLASPPLSDKNPLTREGMPENPLTPPIPKKATLFCPVCGAKLEVRPAEQEEED